MQDNRVTNSIQRTLAKAFLGSVVLAIILTAVVAVLGIGWMWLKDIAGVRTSLTAILLLRDRGLAVENLFTGSYTEEQLALAVKGEGVPDGYRIRIVTLAGQVLYDNTGSSADRIAPHEPMSWLAQYADRAAGPIEAVTHPLVVDGRLYGHLVLTTDKHNLSLAHSTGGTTQSLSPLFLLLGPLLALIFGLALFRSVGRNLVMPIRKLSAVIGEVARGNLSVRTELSDRDDELGLLARDLDSMTQRLATTREQADSLESALRYTMSAVSHDLRTPLTTILAHAEEMQAGVAEDHSASLQLIIDKVALMTQLIKDMSELAALETKEEKWACEKTDLSEVLRRSIIGSFPRLEAQGFELEVSIPENPLWVLLAPQKLERVLDNLLENALKYASDGKWLAVRLIRVKGLARIEIEDKGPGIAVEAQGKIFDRFYRSDTARSSHQEGSGLGLAIAKEIVTKMGGEVGVISPSQGGALFYINFPIFYKD